VLADFGYSTLIDTQVTPFGPCLCKVGHWGRIGWGARLSSVSVQGHALEGQQAFYLCDSTVAAPEIGGSIHGKDLRAADHYSLAITLCSLAAARMVAPQQVRQLTGHAHCEALTTAANMVLCGTQLAVRAHFFELLRSQLPSQPQPPQPTQLRPRAPPLLSQQHPQLRVVGQQPQHPMAAQQHPQQQHWQQQQQPQQQHWQQQQQPQHRGAWGSRPLYV
jgi:hypothetical protein